MPTEQGEEEGARELQLPQLKAQPLPCGNRSVTLCHLPPTGVSSHRDRGQTGFPRAVLITVAPTDPQNKVGVETSTCTDPVIVPLRKPRPGTDSRLRPEGGGGRVEPKASAPPPWPCALLHQAASPPTCSGTARALQRAPQCGRARTLRGHTWLPVWALRKGDPERVTSPLHGSKNSSTGRCTQLSTRLWRSCAAAACSLAGPSSPHFLPGAPPAQPPHPRT